MRAVCLVALSCASLGTCPTGIVRIAGAHLPVNQPPRLAQPKSEGYSIGEYFPVLNIGSKWTYAVKTTKIDRLEYYEVDWQTSGNEVTTQAARYRYRGNDGSTAQILELRVTSLAVPEGRLYPLGTGVELAIDTDEAGLYRRFRSGLHWIVVQPNMFVPLRESRSGPPRSLSVVYQVGRFAKALSPEPVVEDGVSKRVIFLGGVGPGHFVDEQPSQVMDRTMFIGSEKALGRCEDGCLHFRRTVKATTEVPNMSDYLSQGFTEDLWYAKGLGLVSLVQEIGGKTSMTWTLSRFSK